MTTKAAEKIIDALTLLMEGFSELQEGIQKELGPAKDPDEEEDDEDEDEEEGE
jgi:hypothetical protein